VSHVLAGLRMMEVVRYKTNGEERELPAPISAPNLVDPELARSLHRLRFSVQAIVARLRN
jgi:hypothetical protein